MFSKDQIIDFVMQNPIVWIVIPILGAFLVVRKYRRTKRNLEHINDLQSKIVLVVGILGAAAFFAIWLMYF